MGENRPTTAAAEETSGGGAGVGRSASGVLAEEVVRRRGSDSRPTKGKASSLSGGSFPVNTLLEAVRHVLLIPQPLGCRGAAFAALTAGRRGRGETGDSPRR